MRGLLDLIAWMGWIEWLLVALLAYSFQLLIDLNLAVAGLLRLP